MLNRDKWEQSETAYSITWQIVYKGSEKPKGKDRKRQKKQKWMERERKRWEGVKRAASKERKREAPWSYFIADSKRVVWQAHRELLY